MPFEIYATVTSTQEAVELEVTLSSGGAIADPPPSVALRTVDVPADRVPIPLVCSGVGEDLVIVSARHIGRTTRLESKDFEVNCVAPDGTSSSATQTGTTGDPTTDPPSTVGELEGSSSGSGSETGFESDTGDPVDDAEFLAIDYTERMYGLALGVNPAVYSGGQLEVPATDLRVETLAGERIIIGNYEVTAEVGILRGRYTPELDEVEPLPIPGATGPTTTRENHRRPAERRGETSGGDSSGGAASDETGPGAATSGASDSTGDGTSPTGCADAGSSTSAPVDSDDGDAGCGCRSGSSEGWASLVLLAVVAVRRRRD